MLALILTGVSPCFAQSLDQRLDSERYLRGLRDLQLPEIVDQYLKTHPPTNDIEASLQAIARMQAALADHSAVTQPDDRLKTIEALLKARSDLLAKQANDPRRATWLADQASDIFFELLPINQTGLTAIFGLPDVEQRQRAAAAAARMNDAAATAEQAIDPSIRALEAAPNFAKDVMLQQRRRNLAEVERDRRIPFLRGIGAFLDAELNQKDQAQRASAYELSTRALAPLCADVLEGPLLLQARLYDGLAQARLGHYDDAEKRFASVAKDPAATLADVFAARMGGALNRTVHGGPQAGLDGLASIEEKYADPSLLFFRVLIADQRFLLRRAQASAAPAADRARMLAGAFAAYTDLLKAQYPAGSVPRETLRGIVFARLITASSAGDMPVSQLPPIATIAQADAQSRDQSTRESAIISLENLLKTPSLTPDDRAAALFILGRALFEANQPLLAAQRFAQLARDFPADSQAERAMDLAATLTWDEYRRAGGTAGANDQDVRKALRETLDVLLSKYPDLKSIDRWQYAAGRLALLERRFDAAQQHFAKVTPNAAEWLDANFMQAATARDRAGASGSSDTDKPLRQQTIDIAVRVKAVIERGLADAKDPARRAALQYYLAMLRVFQAEAALGLGDPQKAIDMLAGIESDASIGADAIGEAMKVRINAYQTQHKPDEALRDLQRFVQSSPKQAGAVLQPMLASLAGDVQKLLNGGQDKQANELATRTLLPAAKTLEDWLKSSDAPTDLAQRAALERHVAEAYRLAGQCEQALTIYERLLSGKPDASDLLLGRAECLFSLGGEQRLADAMAIYKRLAAAGEATGHDTYWTAQLRMLQILDATDRGTQQIVPRIERLRQGDANFGGERYRKGFEALRAKYAGRPEDR